jgi:hypothetical protein
MSVHELVDAGDHWVLPLAGREVTQCCVDYAVTLVVAEPDATFYVAIEQSFYLTATSDGNDEMFVPDGPPAALAPALGVLHQLVTKAVAYKEGRLELDFGDGTRLRVPAGQKFEAWNLVGPAGLRLVSLPGGELAVWKPDSDDSPSV